MGKRRRNRSSYGRYREDEPDDEEDDIENKKPSKKKSATKEPDKKGDVVLLIVLIAVILIIAGGYFVYNVYYVTDGEDDDDLTEPPQREIQLQVISDSTHNFGESSTHSSDIGGKTDFLLLVTNKGEATDTVSFKSSGGTTGMTLSFDKSELTMDKDDALVVTATVTTGQAGIGSFTITATSVNDAIAKDTVTVNVDAEDLDDRQAQYGDSVTVYYVLVDQGTDDAFKEDRWAFNQDGEFPFTIGSGVIEGFSEMATGMKVGETHVALLPADKAYGNNPTDQRPDGDLMYEMYMKEIK
jgi:hypothetical protein